MNSRNLYNVVFQMMCDFTPCMDLKCTVPVILVELASIFRVEFHACNK